MQDAVETLAEIMDVESGGDPTVAGADARTGRVGGGVEPSALEVEAEGDGDGLAKDPLAFDRVFAVEEGPARPFRAGADRRGERNKLAPEGLKECGNVPALAAGLLF